MTVTATVLHVNVLNESVVPGCVFQAEADFMVSRSAVREAHLNVEALLLRLKEVRERLDRVSREEPHYLDLATKEHKLLQVRTRTGLDQGPDHGLN